MDVPFAVHVDAAGVETLPVPAARLDLQARSLRNTLGVLKRRLRGLAKDSSHTLADAQHYKRVLQHLDERWRDEQGTFAGRLAEIDHALADDCSRLWTECYDIADAMEQEALELPPEVHSVHSRLVDLHGRLRGLLEHEHTTAEVDEVGEELDAIDALRRDHGGVFWGDIEAPAPGNAICNELLSHNFELLRQCARSAHDVPPVLRACEDKLRGIANDLRRLAGQKHHTSADVQHYAFLLGAIASAEAEYEGEWVGSNAKRLLDQCITMVDELETTAEEMPAAVAEVHSQLQLLKKELTALASKAGPPPTDELQRAQRALDTIDNERAAHGGVFGGGEVAAGERVPPGQAVCAHLLEDCYSLVHELEERGGGAAAAGSVPATA